MSIVIGYARQSVDKKKTENSVHSQINAIKKYANTHKIKDVKFISDVKAAVQQHVMGISLCLM